MAGAAPAPRSRPEGAPGNRSAPASPGATGNRKPGTAPDATGNPKPATAPDPVEARSGQRGDTPPAVPEAPVTRGGPEPEGVPAKATGSRRRRPVEGMHDSALTGTAATATTRAAARATGRTAPGIPTGTPVATPTGGSMASPGGPPSPGGTPPTGGPPRGAPPGAPGQPQPRTTTAPAQQPGAVGVSGSAGGSKTPTSQSQGRPPGLTPGGPPSGPLRQAEVEEDIRDVLARLRSGGRKSNENGAFTRAGDEQRLRDLRQERQDLVRGRGGRYRVGEPVVGTRHNGTREALVYDGMASDTHAYVRDPRTGRRRSGTVPVERLRIPAPGVPNSRRAKLHAHLDAAEAAARQKLSALRASRRGGKLAAGLGGFSDLLEEAPHWIEIGAVQMARGLLEFDAWSRRMLEELGDELRATGRNVDELLREIWGLSRRVHGEETHSRGKQTSDLILGKKSLAFTPAERELKPLH